MIHELTPRQLQLRKNSQAGFEVYCTQAIKTAYFLTGYWTSSYMVLFYALFPQTTTENSLIHLKYKVMRKGAQSNISTVWYYLTLTSFWMLQHFSLKGSTCTMKCCYWWITNPSKGNFSAWCDLSEATTCFALTRVIAAALQLENIPGGSGSRFFSYHLALAPTLQHQPAWCYVSKAVCSAAFPWGQSLLQTIACPQCCYISRDAAQHVHSRGHPVVF